MSSLGYVSIEGPATVGTPNYERDVRQTALRYLGAQMGEMYLAATTAERVESVLVTVGPERWFSVDYSRFGA